MLLRRGILHALRVHANGLDGLWLLRLIREHIAVDAGDVHRGLRVVRDLAERGILPVEVRRVRDHDEELAAGAVGRHRARHGQHAQRMLEVVLVTVGGKFAVDLIARAAHAVALRAAALDHEAGDDAVENKAVVKAGVCQLDEVVDLSLIHI